MRSKTRQTLGDRLLTVYFWLAIIYVLLPIVIVIPVSLTTGDFLRFPPSNWGWRWYGEYIRNQEWLDATVLSLKVAFIASAVAMIAGTLAAVGLDRTEFTGKTVLLQVVNAPLVIPHIFLAVGVFVLAVRIRLVGNEYLLAATYSALTIPFVILIVGSALKKVNKRLEQAARILGAGPIRAFHASTLPSILPAVIAGGMLSFFISFDELIVAQFLLGGKETLPMRFWADVQLEVRPTIAAISSILIVVTALGIGTIETLRKRGEQGPKRESHI